MIDLLNPGTARKPLDVRWSRKGRNFYVDNLFMVDCEELDDLQAVLEEGSSNIRFENNKENTIVKTKKITKNSLLFKVGTLISAAMLPPSTTNIS